MNKKIYILYSAVYFYLFAAWLGATVLIVQHIKCPAGIFVLSAVTYGLLGFAAFAGFLHTEKVDWYHVSIVHVILAWPALMFFWLPYTRKMFNVSLVRKPTPEVKFGEVCYLCGSRDHLEISICCHRPVCPRDRYGTGSLSDGYTCMKHPFGMEVH